MRKLFSILGMFFMLLGLAPTPVEAQQTATNFIYPVKATDVNNILDNINDPADGHGWVIYTSLGSYYNNGSDCLTGYHDADDYNRTGAANNDLNAPVYAVANGTDKIIYSFFLLQQPSLVQLTHQVYGTHYHE